MEVILRKSLETLRSNDADSNENVKKTKGLISKTTLQVHHAFLYTSFLFLHGFDVKIPNFARFKEDVNKHDELLFLFLSLNMVTWDLALGLFAYIWQSG